MRYKHKVDYYSNDGIVEIVIRDPSGKKEAKFVFNQSDNKQIHRVGLILKEKYGIDFNLTEERGFFDS